MVQYSKLILGIINGITGCVAGTILLGMTENYWYLIINFITGGVGGALVAYALQEGNE